jgi:hypothetical protein
MGHDRCGSCRKRRSRRCGPDCQGCGLTLSVP